MFGSWKKQKTYLWKYIVMKVNENDIEITSEQIKFIVGELNKVYIPTDNIKEEFFARFAPDIRDEDIKDCLVIMNIKHKVVGLPEWIKYDAFIDEDKIIILNKKGLTW